jgi:spore coat polysaccharide biosynthesis protein SpsF (cytidylyltransferase family)
MHHETVMKVLERTLKENKPIAYSKMKVTGALQETLEKLMGEYVETMESEQTRLTMKYATDRKLANNLLERVAKQNAEILNAEREALNQAVERINSISG